MSKEVPDSGWSGNLTEQFERVRTIRSLARWGKWHGRVPDYSDIDCLLYPATILPEAGEGRSKLIEESRAILQQETMTPDQFNSFVYNMIDLLGGRRFNSESAASNTLLVQGEQPHSINFYRTMRMREDQLNFGTIELGPIWLSGFGTGLLEKRLKQNKSPIMFTLVTYGYSDYGKRSKRPYPAMTQHIALPDNHLISPGFVYGVEMNTVGNTLITRPQKLTDKQLQEFCRGVFEVYTRQVAKQAATA